MSETTTPKRNEAVALWVPNGHVLPDGSWEPGPGELVSIDEASDFQKQHGFPLYPQSALDALQGEVSRLRGLLSDTAGNLRRMANDEFADCDQVRLEHVVNRIEDNLEPTTDGH